MWGRQVNSSTTAKTAQNQGRLSDLEGDIRTVYRELIRALEQKIQIADQPNEKLRAKRELKEYWDLIWSYAEEYIPLCKEMKHEIPQDIYEYISSAKLKIARKPDQLQLIAGQMERAYVITTKDYMDRLVDEWARQVSSFLPISLYHNPCAMQVYEEENELWSDKYIVWHPAYDAVWTQQSTILFADVGCGKSACRLSAKSHFQSNGIFVIEYSGWKDLVGAVSQSYARSAHLGLANLVDLASDLGCASV